MDFLIENCLLGLGYRQGVLVISRLLMIGSTASLLIAPAYANEAQQVPEYIGQVNAVQGAQVMPLERQNAQTDFKIRALGFGGGKMRLLVQGEKSPVRFRSGDHVTFIIRAANTDIDPLEFIRLVPVRSGKGKRELETISTGFAGATGARDRLNERAIPFTASRVGKVGFRMSLSAPLAPGEYAVQALGWPSLSLFGVD